MKNVGVLVLTSAFFLCSTTTMAKSPEAQVEYSKKKAPSENTSNGSAKQKVQENTRASLDKLKNDSKKK